MTGLIIGFVVASILMIVEYLLCIKMKSSLWGGIIPCVILIGTIYIFTSGKVPLDTKTVFPFVILNSIFFSDWATGRDKYKKIQQAEIDKMKAKDL
ncbi:hypothetical protein [Clostridioides difficile]|nr:hypothetical protein [Clostridioides difficile]EGT3680214.1 hypothetical protein [Clostridioides difficile]EGT3809934.1 hypothetical protein [Clostridioides difficile]EGT3863201.1 hypothetical protein [Clostridioides difficile]EGT4770054.1 hypothetical protein [Clostridioides difficile]EGT4996194.1 hypothetical protein [Clostridioides difficile]